MKRKKVKKEIARMPVVVHLPVVFWVDQRMSMRRLARLMFELGHEVKPQIVPRPASKGESK